MQYAISYTRFSSGKQQHGTSLDRQNEMVLSYCRENNLELLHTYHDSGRSGYHAKHLKAGGQLRELLERVRNGDIPKNTHLLVEQTDRLSRQPLMEALQLIQELTLAGLTIVTLDDKQKYDRNVDIGQFIQLASRFHRGYDESQSKSARLTKAWSVKTEQMQQGIVPKMRLPFWLERNESDEVVVLDEWVQLIKDVLNMCIRGLGGSEIAVELNSSGRLQKSGANWNNTRVTTLIRNRQLIGWHTRKATKETYFCLPPVVPIELFNRAQKALDSRVRSKGNSQKWSSALSGLTSCGQCGSVLKFSGKSKHRTAVCRAAVDSRSCSNRRSIRYKALILGAVAALSTSLASFIHSQEPQHSSDDKDAINQELEAVNHKISNIVKAIGSLQESGMQVPELTKELAEANEQRERLKSKLATHEVQQDPDTRLFAMLKLLKGDIPELVTKVLDGDKESANRLNILLRSIDGFSITLNDGIAHIGQSKVWIEGKTIMFSNDAVGETSITKVDPKIERFTIDKANGQTAEVEYIDGGTPLGAGYQLLL